MEQYLWNRELWRISVDSFQRLAATTKTQIESSQTKYKVEISYNSVLLPPLCTTPGTNKRNRKDRKDQTLVALYQCKSLLISVLV